jgi:hypothetical protein
LLHNPRRQDIRLAQVQVLLAELDRHARTIDESNGTKTYLPVILCGDFNLQTSSSLLGYLSTFIFFSTGNYYDVILIFISYGSLTLIQISGTVIKQRGFVVIGLQIITIFIWLVTLLPFVKINIQIKSLFNFFNFSCSEMIEWKSSTWQHLRGSALVISMKAISIAFDVDSKKLTKLPPIYEYAGYQFCPANIVLGPFVSFNSYKNYTKGFKIPLKLIIQIIANSILSIMFIFFSTCFLNYLISDNAR